MKTKLKVAHASPVYVWLCPYCQSRQYGDKSEIQEPQRCFTTGKFYTVTANCPHPKLPPPLKQMIVIRHPDGELEMDRDMSSRWFNNSEGTPKIDRKTWMKNKRPGCSLVHVTIHAKERLCVSESSQQSQQKQLPKSVNARSKTSGKC